MITVLVHLHWVSDASQRLRMHPRINIVHPTLINVSSFVIN